MKITHENKNKNKNTIKVKNNKITIKQNNYETIFNSETQLKYEYLKRET